MVAINPRAYAVTTTELVGRSVKKRISMGGRALYPPSRTNTWRSGHFARMHARACTSARACISQSEITKISREKHRGKLPYVESEEVLIIKEIIDPSDRVFICEENAVRRN